MEGLWDGVFVPLYLGTISKWPLSRVFLEGKENVAVCGEAQSSYMADTWTLPDERQGARHHGHFPGGGTAGVKGPGPAWPESRVQKTEKWVEGGQVAELDQAGPTGQHEQLRFYFNIMGTHQKVSSEDCHDLNDFQQSLLLIPGV